jgi:transcriptional antiterminator NusG
MGDIYALRTTAGRETQVMDKLVARVKQHGLMVYAILKPREVKGYFFVEAGSIDDLNKAIYGVQHAKGVIGTVRMDEIKHFLIPAQEQIKIQVGDIVEIVSGPFRGENAKVKRVTKVKEEVVVELLEAAVPIPITVKLDSVRLIKPEEKGEQKAE